MVINRDKMKYKEFDNKKIKIHRSERFLAINIKLLIVFIEEIRSTIISLYVN